MYIVSLTYKKDLSVVENFIQDHARFLDKNYANGKFIFSGRKVPRTGGVILVRQMERKELDLILREDPFYLNEIADYDITEVLPTKYDRGFAAFVEE